MQLFLCSTVRAREHLPAWAVDFENLTLELQPTWLLLQYPAQPSPRVVRAVGQQVAWAWADEE